MRTPIFLSRLPIHSDKANKEVDEVRLINLLQIESLPMNVDQVRKATRMMAVWPDKQITLYFSERHEIQSEMIVYCREFEFHERVLYELHQSKVSTDLSRETQTGAYAWLKTLLRCRSHVAQFFAWCRRFTFDGSFGNNHGIGETARICALQI